MEETESEYKSELKLWENTDGKIWVQVGYDDTDPYSTHGIAITKDDAQALIKELTRLIGYVPTQEIKIKKPEGQQLTIQKVNWSK